MDDFLVGEILGVGPEGGANRRRAEVRGLEACAVVGAVVAAGIVATARTRWAVEANVVDLDPKPLVKMPYYLRLDLQVVDHVLGAEDCADLRDPLRACRGGQVVLLCLQIFWMSLLLKMVVKKLRGEDLTSDIRSDSDDSDGEGNGDGSRSSGSTRKKDA